MNQSKIHLLQQKISEDLASSTNNLGMYNYDQAIELLININIENRNYIVEQLKEVYLAGDVDNDGSIGINEFLML